MINEFIEVFPVGKNVGKDILTPVRVSPDKAAKLVRTKLWSYQPKATSQQDVDLMVVKAKQEVNAELQALNAERAALLKEREELEALRAETLTSGRGRKKSEV